MVTIKDVAEKAGVSTSAVSAVLGNRAKVIALSEATRNRIHEAANQLGYRRNAFAAQSRSGKSRILAYIGTDFSQEYNFRILSAALETAQEYGYSIKVFSVNFDRNSHKYNLIKQLNLALEFRPAGILIAGTFSCADTSAVNQYASDCSVPVFFLGNLEPNDACVNLQFDDCNGMNQAVRYLHEVGHRRIGFLSGDLDRLYVQNRFHSFSDALKQGRLEQNPEWVWHEKDGQQSLSEFLGELLRRDNLPSAFCCDSDYNALNAIMYLLRLGKSIPEDISIIGFGDMRIATLSAVKLTTVAQHFEKMGRDSVMNIIKVIEHLAIPPKHIGIASELKIRESVKNPAKQKEN